MPSRKSDGCPTFATAYVGRKRWAKPIKRFWLVVQILPPLVIRVANHAHDMSAGMQRERTRLTQQLNLTELAEQMIPLPAIAGVATRNQILPGGKTATRSRNHMVQREFTRRQNHPTILAAVAITEKDVLAREGARLMGNTTIFKQAD